MRAPVSPYLTKPLRSLEEAMADQTENLLPAHMVQDYERRAEAERNGGGSIEIDFVLPYVAVTLSDGSEYFFQEHEAAELLREVPDNILPEDYVLAVAQGW